MYIHAHCRVSTTTTTAMVGFVLGGKTAAVAVAVSAVAVATAAATAAPAAR
jgi:hypothetical protein